MERKWRVEKNQSGQVHKSRKAASCCMARPLTCGARCAGRELSCEKKEEIRQITFKKAAERPNASKKSAIEI
jgi:hypothetical protein